MLMFRPWSQKGPDLSSASVTSQPCDPGYYLRDYKFPHL